MRIKILQLLEALFRYFEAVAKELGDMCAVCQDCGRNRYTAPPCVNQPPVSPFLKIWGEIPKRPSKHP